MTQILTQNRKNRYGRDTIKEKATLKFPHQRASNGQKITPKIPRPMLLSSRSGVRVPSGVPFKKCNQHNRIWWIWPSRLRRQIVALKIVGSSPIIHPRKTGDIFGYLLFLYGFWRIMRLERSLRKQSGGLFSDCGRVPWNAGCGSKEP